MRSKVAYYTVSALIVDENDDGEIIGKVTTQPLELCGHEALTDHLVSIDKLVAERTAELKGSRESEPAS